jgi:hypothetical protein
MDSNSEISKHSKTKRSVGNSRASLKRKKLRTVSISRSENASKLTEISVDSNGCDDDDGKSADDPKSTPVDLSNLEIIDILNIPLTSDITSGIRAQLLMNKLLSPLEYHQFQNQYQDKAIYHGSQRDPNYYRRFFSSNELKSMIQNHINCYITDIILSYTEGQVYENGHEMRHQKIFEYYQRGSCIRYLYPQKYSDNIWKLLSALEFGYDSALQCHANLLPPKSKNFDGREINSIEFLLQIEGDVQCELELMSSTKSSTDMKADKLKSSNEHIKTRRNLMKVKLKQGDILYIPKGYKLYDSNTSATESSLYLHVFVDNGDVVNTSDLIQMLLSQILDPNITDSNEPTSAGNGGISYHLLNRILPRSMLTSMGVANSENTSDSLRTNFIQNMSDAFDYLKLKSLEILDAAVDQV